MSHSSVLALPPAGEVRRTRRCGSLRPCLAAALLLVGSRAASASDLLTDFQPSPIQSDYGNVQQVEIKTPYLLALEPTTLAYHSPGSMLHLRFPETVWILAYETEIYDSSGQTPKENYLCHTFLGNQRVEQVTDHAGHVIANEMRVVFSDSFTRRMQLPAGFGIRLSPDDDVQWVPMFNNRGDDVMRLGMQARIHFIRDADLKKPLQPLYSVLEAVQTPHLFFVPPGRHQKEAQFTLNFDGKIHFIGAHIHPYSESIVVWNVSRDEPVWEGHSKVDANGKTVGMEVYSSEKGYPVHAGETYALRSVYNNPTQDYIDAMAGAFIFYSRDSAGEAGPGHVHPTQRAGH
jgi:hypothetical protein